MFLDNSSLKDLTKDKESYYRAIVAKQIMSNCFDGDIKKVNKDLLKKYINESVCDGTSPLVYLCSRNPKLESVRYLVDLGAIVDYCSLDSNYSTPLMEISLNFKKHAHEHKKTINIIKYLISQGADVNAEINARMLIVGFNCLLSFGRFSLLNLLLKNGFDINKGIDIFKNKHKKHIIMCLVGHMFRDGGAYKKEALTFLFNNNVKFDFITSDNKDIFEYINTTAKIKDIQLFESEFAKYEKNKLSQLIKTPKENKNLSFSINKI